MAAAVAMMSAALSASAHTHEPGIQIRAHQGRQMNTHSRERRITTTRIRVWPIETTSRIG